MKKVILLFAIIFAFACTQDEELKLEEQAFDRCGPCENCWRTCINSEGQSYNEECGGRDCETGDQ